MNVTNDIKKYVNHLIDAGHTGLSEQPNGCSTYDEEHLASLLIKSEPHWSKPSVVNLDIECQLWDMLASYMKEQTLEAGNIILNYLVENAVATYKLKLMSLFEVHNAKSIYESRL